MENRQRLRAPLTAIAVFEAAAWHGNFARAAEEFGITPSAVSHQVRKLEGQLGWRLFERGRRGVRLTAEGLAYAEACHDALGTLREADRRTRRARDVVRIAAEPLYGRAMLLPALPAFERTRRPLRIQLELAGHGTRLTRNEADLVVGLETSEKGTRTTSLTGIAWVGVTSPAYEERLRRTESERKFGPPGHAYAHLWGCTALTTVATRALWLDWARAAGLAGIRPAREVVCADLGTTYAASVDGAGIAIVPEPCAAADIRDGRVVRAHPYRSPDGEGRGAYKLACRAEDAEISSIRHVWRWITNLNWDDDLTPPHA